MSKIFIKTLPITLIRVIITFSPALVFIVSMLILRNVFVIWDMHSTTLMLTVPIALGIGTLYNRTIVRFFDFIFRLVHTIAVTIIILEQPYKGLLIFYAWKETFRNLISHATTSIITIKGVKLVKTLKTALLEKTIGNHLFDPGGISIGHTLFKFVMYNVRMALEAMDEILVSYTWFTQELFRRHWVSENGSKKITLKTRVRNQAKFFLEGAGLYIRVLPKMLVYNTLYLIAIEVLVFIVLVGTSIMMTISMGFGWWNFLFMFFSTRALILAVNIVIVPSLRVNVALWQFYNQINKLDSLAPEYIHGLTQQLPPLAWVAKQTGDPEYKDVSITLNEANNVDACASDIVPWEDCEAALRDLVNNSVKVFQVHEVDVLEPCGGKQPEPEFVSDEVSYVPEEVTQDNNNIYENETDTTEFSVLEPEEQESSVVVPVEDKFNIQMPSDDLPPSVIKKANFESKMSDMVDVDDLI